MVGIGLVYDWSMVGIGLRYGWFVGGVGEGVEMG